MGKCCEWSPSRVAVGANTVHIDENIPNTILKFADDTNSVAREVTEPLSWERVTSGESLGLQVTMFLPHIQDKINILNIGQESEIYRT